MARRSNMSKRTWLPSLEQAARITFWRVCLLSRVRPQQMKPSQLSQTDWRRAFGGTKSQFRDTDLDSIRDLPGFKELVDEIARNAG